MGRYRVSAEVEADNRLAAMACLDGVPGLADIRVRALPAPIKFEDIPTEVNPGLFEKIMLQQPPESATLDPHL